MHTTERTGMVGNTGEGCENFDFATMALNPVSS